MYPVSESITEYAANKLKSSRNRNVPATDYNWDVSENNHSQKGAGITMKYENGKDIFSEN